MDQLLGERDVVLENLKEQLSRAHDSMKQWADKKRRDVTCELRDKGVLEGTTL